MVNHHRGLWGYTGTAADGQPLTIQSTGLGGPSAAAVVTDLVRLGARRLVRVGTCAAVDGGLALGALVTADPVLAADGTSRALGAAQALRGDVTLAGGLPPVPVASTDLAGGPGPLPAGARGRDLTSAAVLAAAAGLGVTAAVLLAVAQDAHGRQLDDGALHAAELELGRAAAAALGS